MSRTFIDVSLLKLKYVNKLKSLPVELIQIIKSFCFIHYEEAQKIRFYQQQKAIANQLIKSAFSRNCTIEEIVSGYGEWASAEPIISSNSSCWIFGFSNNQQITQERWDYDTIPCNYSYQQELDLRGENCKKCGEYTFLSYSTFPHTHSHMKLCTCNSPDLTSGPETPEWDDGYEWYW